MLSNSGSSYREILVTCMVIAKESINLLSNSTEPDLGQAAVVDSFQGGRCFVRRHRHITGLL